MVRTLTPSFVLWAAQMQELPFRLAQQVLDEKFPPYRHYYQTGTFVKVSHQMEPLDVRDRTCDLTPCGSCRVWRVFQELSTELFEVIHRHYSVVPSPLSSVVCEPHVRPRCP